MRNFGKNEPRIAPKGRSGASCEPVPVGTIERWALFRQVLGALDNHGNAHAAADAEGRQAVPALPLLHFGQQGH